MKLLSIAVPSYNSESYLSKCIESLLVGGEDVEIIIVNDGSKDKTKEIADAYVQKYPTIVKAIHKENGGHGSGVNYGLAEATGLYYKVVDSDDWLDGEAYLKFLAVIKENLKNNVDVDLYVTNFVYDRAYDNTTFSSEYQKELPENRVSTWKEAGKFRTWKMLLMHAVTFKTEKLRKDYVDLPEHTFYVDNLFAYRPLPNMEKIYYLNVDLYHYYIGRSDQSVTVENMGNRYDQQLRVTGLMLASHRYEELCSFPKPLKKLMMHELLSVMLNTYFFTTRKDTKERREGLDLLWQNLKASDKKMYKKMRSRPTIRLLNVLSWRLKGKLTAFSYKVLCNKIKLGV